MIRSSSIMLSLLVVISACNDSGEGISLRKKENCNVEVQNVFYEPLLGKSVGFYIEFKNNSEKHVDAIHYRADFKDKFGDKVESKEFRWQSGLLYDDIGKEEVVKDLHVNWVEGANSIDIEVIKVHYTDDSRCECYKSIFKF